jgi:hypothetical protein
MSLSERWAMGSASCGSFSQKCTDGELQWTLAAGIHNYAFLLIPRGNDDRLFSVVSSLVEENIRKE